MGSVLFNEMLRKVEVAANEEHAVVLILTQSYNELKCIVDKCLNVLQDIPGTYKHNQRRWENTEAGSLVLFNAIQDDVYKFCGVQATHIFIVGEVGEFQLRFMTSRLRSAKYKGDLVITLVEPI